MSDKDSKELLIAINVLSLDIVRLVKKHAGVLDMAAALLADADLKDALSKAIEGIANVPSEIKEMGMSDILDLAQVQISMIPKIVEALKA